MSHGKAAPPPIVMTLHRSPSVFEYLPGETGRRIEHLRRQDREFRMNKPGS